MRLYVTCTPGNPGSTYKSTYRCNTNDLHLITVLWSTQHADNRRNWEKHCFYEAWKSPKEKKLKCGIKVPCILQNKSHLKPFTILMCLYWIYKKKKQEESYLKGITFLWGHKPYQVIGISTEQQNGTSLPTDKVSLETQRPLESISHTVVSLSSVTSCYVWSLCLQTLHLI